MHREVIYEQLQFVLNLFDLRTFSDMTRLAIPNSYLSMIETRSLSLPRDADLKTNHVKAMDNFLYYYPETPMASLYGYRTASYVSMPNGAIYISFNSDNKYLKPLSISISPNDLPAFLKALNANPRHVFESVLPKHFKVPDRALHQLNLKEKELLPIVTDLKEQPIPEIFITNRSSINHYARHYYPTALVTEDFEKLKDRGPFVISGMLLHEMIEKKLKEIRGESALDPLLARIFSKGVLEWTDDIKEPEVTNLTSNDMAKVTTIDGKICLMLTSNGLAECTDYYENLGRN